MTKIVMGAIAALMATAPVGAAVIQVGAYDAGRFDGSAAATLGPGRYVFSIALTSPIPFVDGYAEKITTTNFYCVDPDVGPDEFACGGDNVPTSRPGTR